MKNRKTNSKLKCPECGGVIYGWRNASKHAEENKHWGNYNIEEEKQDD